MAENVIIDGYKGQIKLNKYMGMAEAELEEMCKGLTLGELTAAPDDKKAAIGAFIIKALEHQWNKNKPDTEILDAIINILLYKDQIVKHIEDIDAFADRQPNRSELDKMSLDKVEELFAKYLLTLQHPFLPMVNGPGTNMLMSLNTKNNPPIIDPITGTAIIEQGNLKVFIEEYKEQSVILRPSARKLLDACAIKLTEQNHYKGPEQNIKPLVVFSLDRYMELCGAPLTKPSKDKMRRKVKEDLDTLYSISMEWEENCNAKLKSFSKRRICDMVEFRGGNIVFSFASEMAFYLMNEYITLFPLELFKLDERNENAYNMGRKLMLCNSIDNNNRKGTAKIISVKSLLKECPQIPSYEKVINEGRQLDQRIVQPFEKALNALTNIKWEYCNSKYIPLTNDQLKIIAYDTFETLYISFEIMGSPDQTKRREAKDQEADKKKNQKRTPQKHTI